MTAPAVEVEPEPIAVPEPVPVSNFEQRQLADLEFAEKFLRGEMPDSCGNFYDGHNAHFNAGTTGALGPQEPVIRPRPSTTEHMNPALVGGAPQFDAKGEVIDCANAPNHPLLRDFKGVPTPTRMRHPNQTRAEFLSMILRDVSRGWSR